MLRLVGFMTLVFILALPLFGKTEAESGAVQDYWISEIEKESSDGKALHSMVVDAMDYSVRLSKVDQPGYFHFLSRLEKSGTISFSKFNDDSQCHLSSLLTEIRYRLLASALSMGRKDVAAPTLKKLGLRKPSDVRTSSLPAQVYKEYGRYLLQQKDHAGAKQAIEHYATLQDSELEPKIHGVYSTYQFIADASYEADDFFNAGKYYSKVISAINLMHDRASFLKDEQDANLKVVQCLHLVGLNESAAAWAKTLLESYRDNKIVDCDRARFFKKMLDRGDIQFTKEEMTELDQLIQKSCQGNG